MREAVRFLLGHELRELRQVDPTMTVLDWLRLCERRVGTKEGCAEGDCGACTVVVARPEGDRLRYEAVNACILFVPTLDGAQLITVEDLKGGDGALHPVQRALVETHGSQCGFCTPGFVMSLFALFRSPPPRPSPIEGEGVERPSGDELSLPPCGGGSGWGVESINDALAGNLCRCTGYGPIIAAATRMLELCPDRTDPFSTREQETLERLRALRDGETVSVTGDGRRFFAPATTDALAELLLEHPDAWITSGATDVGLWVTKQMQVLDPVVWVGRVAELQRITETEDAIEIGAAASLSAAMPAIARHYADFGELLRRFGSVQVRNAGTVGGNVANGSPIGDMPPALIAAGATLHLRRGNERRKMPVEEFFLDYGKQDRRASEFVERITLPKPAAGMQFRAYKISKRFDQDISAVCGCFNLRLESGRVADVRIAYGGMAAIPKRARETEATLRGEPWTRATIEAGMAALARDFRPITDWRASSAYRMQVAQNLLMKLFIETTDGSSPTRLLGAREPALA